MVRVKQDKKYATSSLYGRRTLALDERRADLQGQGGVALLAQEQRAEVDMAKGQESRKDCGLETRYEP